MTTHDAFASIHEERKPLCNKEYDILHVTVKTSSTFAYIILILSGFCGMLAGFTNPRTDCTLINKPIQLVAYGCVSFTEEQMIRARKMYLRVCSDDERVCDITPPFVPFPAHFTISKKHKVNNCVIRKNMSTVMNAIICFLTKPQFFLENNRSLLHEGTENRSCKDENEPIYTISDVAEWTNIALVREPVERFVSGYLQQCKRHDSTGQCHGCEGNFACMVKMNLIEQNAWISTVMKASEAHAHFTPQSWQCEFSEHFSEYTLIKYNSSNPEPTYSEIWKSLEQNGVPVEHLEHIFGQLRTARTNHATFSDPEIKWYKDKLLKNRKLVIALIKQYFYDFILFDYPFPAVPTGYQ